MIKTVFFSCDYPHHDAIDDQINSWPVGSQYLASSFLKGVTA